MKIIYTSEGNAVKVSNLDYEFLNQFAWSTRPNGYVYTSIQTGRRKQSKVTIHRAITLAPEGIIIDHIDGDPWNNVRENLRIATVSQNAQNRRKTTKPKSSKYKGVNWDKSRNKWRAVIGHNGKSFQLGRFDSEEEAAIAYNQKAKELFGEFAFINEIGG